MKTFQIAVALALSLSVVTDAFVPVSNLQRSGWTLKATTETDEKKERFSMPDMSEVADAASRAMDLSNFDVSTVVGNLQKGELGSRGEVYFAAQAALVLCILLGGVPVVGDTIRAFLGPGLLLGGSGVALLSVVDLGSDSLSPFPKPTDTGSLKDEGIYSQMRHPMYAGLLAIMFGLSILTNSADRLLLSVGLLYLFEVKTTQEEEFLKEQFGVDYEDYMTEVPSKFLPAAFLELLQEKKE